MAQDLVNLVGGFAPDEILNMPPGEQILLVEDRISRTPGRSSLRNSIPPRSSASCTLYSVPVCELMLPSKDSIRQMVPIATRALPASFA
jgi:hypothetical protein